MKPDTLLTILGVAGIGAVVGLAGGVLNYFSNFSVDAQGRAKVEVHGINLVLTVTLFGSGILMFILALGLVYNFGGADTLPAAQGTVLAISAYDGSFRNPSTGEVEAYDGLNVEFVYAIDGVEYHTISETLLDEKTRFWEVGDTVPVYYYPMFPRFPMLSPLDSQVIFLTAGFGGVFMLIVLLEVYIPHLIHAIVSRFRS